MLIIKKLVLLRKHMYKIRKKGKYIALVPTMGNLHDGHIKLINEAKMRADIVVVSIFVNPMQFDRINDLTQYPHTLQEDYEKLNKHHVDFTFVPTKEDLYPKGIKEITYIDIPNISSILEGAKRPGHFRGVLTIINKFFNLIQPNFAFFGEKDYQQLMLIRKMVIDLNYHIDIIGIPIVRDKDGLAFSSRNIHLNSEQRKLAPYLNNVLTEMEEDFNEGKYNLQKIIFIAKQKLKRKGFLVEDIQIRDANTLLEITRRSKSVVILISAWLGEVRLIDNKIVQLKSK